MHLFDVKHDQRCGESAHDGEKNIASLFVIRSCQFKADTTTSHVKFRTTWINSFRFKNDVNFYFVFWSQVAVVTPMAAILPLESDSRAEGSLFQSQSDRHSEFLNKWAQRTAFLLFLYVVKLSVLLRDKERKPIPLGNQFKRWRWLRQRKPP